MKSEVLRCIKAGVILSNFPTVYAAKQAIAPATGDTAERGTKTRTDRAPGADGAAESEVTKVKLTKNLSRVWANLEELVTDMAGNDKAMDETAEIIASIFPRIRIVMASSTTPKAVTITGLKVPATQEARAA